jgi:acetate kinase
MGLALDVHANARATADAEIAEPSSQVRILALHTREELIIARETARVLHGRG